ncbi:MAG: cytochrome c-type biogenesis protein CcmH, partial [Pseudomonadota bacterium]
MIRLMPFLLGLILVASAFAEPARAPNAAEVEARTKAISKTLRCVVCQNESIADSSAPLAADMR